MRFTVQATKSLGAALSAIVLANTGHAASLGAGANVFNPATSVILDGEFAPFNNDPSRYAVPGFPVGDESTPAAPGWSLGESELVMSANIDDYFFGSITVALAPEGGIEVEEAFVDTTSLGGGVTARGGRFLSGIGYLNDRHAHTWDFADIALPYRLLLGNQVRDDGIQVRWVLPTDLFAELGLEAMRGESYPAGGAAHNGRGAYAAFAHIGGDVGEGHSWRVGVSQLRGRAEGRELSGENISTAADLESMSFSGTARVTLLDLVWKWAPQGNPRQRNLALAFEYLRRNEDGQLSTTLVGGGGETAYRGTQSGWYAQAVYRVTQSWRGGIRLARVRSDNHADDAAVLADAGLESGGHVPKVWSAMVDYNRSEFSRVRLQVNLDDSGAQTDKQLVLQYVVSIGAHGAHKF